MTKPNDPEISSAKADKRKPSAPDRHGHLIVYCESTDLTGETYIKALDDRDLKSIGNHARWSLGVEHADDIIGRTSINCLAFRAEQRALHPNYVTLDSHTIKFKHVLFSAGSSPSPDFYDKIQDAFRSGKVSDEMPEGVPDQATNPDDDERLAFLVNAARLNLEVSDPLQQLDAAVRADAIELLGGEAALGRKVLSQEDLVEALSVGFPADVLGRLREAGFAYAVLEQVVAPRRTLMRRKSAQQRLTRSESDAAWRLAHVLSFASHVLDGRKAALAWLSRGKGVFKGRTALDLIETSVGTAYVERILRNLDWGDVA
jgi:putative toxin-antitoxin system antitoxin component (TIGR02293 family)